MTVSDVVPPAIPDEPPAPPALSADDIAGARSFVDTSRAASIRRAYAADWRRIVQWCPALPANPALVAVYLSALSLRVLARPSVGRALAAIVHAHKRAVTARVARQAVLHVWTWRNRGESGGTRR